MWAAEQSILGMTRMTTQEGGGMYKSGTNTRGSCASELACPMHLHVVHCQPSLIIAVDVGNSNSPWLRPLF